MKALFSILITVTALTSCAEKTIDAPPNYGTKTASFSYLALGDSYTIGQSVLPAQSFPYQLTAALNLQTKITAPTIIATTGWTTDNLIDAISSNTASGKTYDIVTLLIGVNDQYQGISADSYRASFVKVLNTAIAFANGDKNRVFVLSIPDYGVTPFANGADSTIGPAIDAFNTINKAESGNAGVNYLDITGISRQAANDPSLIAPDGLHPSAKMYVLWVQQLAPMVMAQLVK